MTDGNFSFAALDALPDLHPVLPLLLAALAMPALRDRGRRVASLIGSGLSLLLLPGLPAELRQGVTVLGADLVLLRVDGLARVFALAFSAYAVLASVYAWSERGTAAKAFSMTLAAGGVGVALAGDLLTLFLFWELLTVSSLVLIWQGRGRGALDAGFRYLLMHLAGGICLLAGILLHWGATGSIVFESMSLAGPAAWLMAVGMLTNAALPPLHAWLPDAYPRATVFGTVFLSAFTTKAAVYALARAFPGSDPLVWMGALMTLYGVTFAVIENDMRRLLGYHIVSQVGYMICGVGLGTALALNGTSAHAFSHIFYKGLLMMSAGAVIHATGHGKLSDLGGLARPLRWTLAFMLIGAFSISGVPLFNGFVSKALVISASAYGNRPAIELILLVASMGTFLSLGLKMPWFAFFAPGRDGRETPVRRPVPRSMYAAMGAAAAICIATGIFPGLLYSLLPFGMEYEPYTPDHVVGSLQILTGTALGFWLLRGMLAGVAKRTLDVDWLYRGPVRRLVEGAGGFLEGSGLRAGRLLAAALSAGARLWTRVSERSPRLSAQAFTVASGLVLLGLLLFLG